MKKMIHLLALCVLALVGCSSDGIQAASRSSSFSTQDLDAEIVISTQDYNKQYYKSDGKTVWGNYKYQLPLMEYVGQDAALQSCAASFNAEIAKIYEDNAAYCDEYIDMVSAFEDEVWETICLSNEISYQLSRVGKAISVTYEHYLYTGGAHGGTYNTSQLFSAESGGLIALSVLAEDGAAMAEAVADEILRQIRAEELDVQYSYWNEYPDYVQEWVSSIWLENTHSVFFYEDGTMEIIFGTYELASYAAGPQTFTIPVKVYEPYLNDYGRTLLGVVA